jgi:hypothetical protein
VLDLDHPADGGDVAHGRDPLARAGHLRSRVSRSSGSGAPMRAASWHHGGEQVDDVLKAGPGRPSASGDARLARDGHLDDSADVPAAVAGLHAAEPPTRYLCQISHASPTVGRRTATRAATASARSTPLMCIAVPFRSCGGDSPVRCGRVERQGRCHPSSPTFSISCWDKRPDE